MPKLKLGSIIALVVGPILIIMNYLETTEKQTIAREGISTIAIPTAKISRKGRRGGRSYKLEVQYPIQTGGMQTERISVSRELYDKADSQPLLPIKYSAKDPSKLIIVGQSIENPAMYVVGSALLVLGAVGTWWYFIRRRPEMAPLASAPAGSPSVAPPPPAPRSPPPSAVPPPPPPPARIT